MRPLVQVLQESYQKVVSDHEYDPQEINLEIPNFEWSDPVLYLGGISIRINVPGEEDAEGIEGGIRFQLGGFPILRKLEPLIELLQFADALSKEFRSRISDLAEEIKAKREAEEKEREEREAKRRETLEERRNMLLNEFLGETGRIRAYGSRTFQPVTVTATETPDGVFVPHFEWINSHDYGRVKDLPRIRIFDIKIGSRYKEVWNDGEDDLSYYDQESFKRGNVKKYDGDFRI
jgi:hypothetical protein